MPSLCVFCGSRSGSDPRFVALAKDTGRIIARAGWQLVYGGGRVGLMGELADAALAAGGKVAGVIPLGLHERELAHRGLTRLDVVPSMHARKARMAELADAFIALPGGIGTLEELFEVWTWAQLDLHSKPVGLLNVDGYFDKLLAFLVDTCQQGFLDEEERCRLIVANTPEALLAQIADASRATDTRRFHPIET